MRKMVLDERLSTFAPSEADSQWIYAGITRGGVICITTKEYDSAYYHMKLLCLGESKSGFTYGDGYYYSEEESLSSLLEKFLRACDAAVYEFHTVREFLEWALEVEKKKE